MIYIYKYVYSGYSIGFDLCSEFSLSDGSAGKNVIIFGVHMSSSVHIDNKAKAILTLGKGPTQELDDTKLTEEAKYSISFLKVFKQKEIYNGSNIFDLLML